MSIAGSDVLKMVAVPFRIHNVKELDIDEFVFSLSLEAFQNCSISTAKKILHLALEQEKIKRVNDSLIIQFNPWEVSIPLTWKPEFKGLEKIPEEKLKPLPDVPPLEIKRVTTKSVDEAVISEPFQYKIDLTSKIKEKVEKREKDEVKEEKKQVEKPKKKKTTVVKTEEKVTKQKKLVEMSDKKKKVKKEKKTKTLMDYM